MAYNEIISMQDMRTSLAEIADRVQSGTKLLVVRNSRPAFMLVPLQDDGPEREISRKTWEAIEKGLDKEPVFSEEDVVAMVRDYRRRKTPAK